jgi:bifunctional non-homologous end joining protein LigD
VVVAPALAGRVICKLKEIEKELFAGREENVLIEIDGKRQRLSNLNKVYWPEAGITKRELLAYYYRMAAHVLPYLKDRPMVLRRYPDGWKGEAFFQKEAREPYPEWMPTTPVPSEHAGKEVPYFLCNDISALLYLTNLGCIDHNPWPSRRGTLEKPDYLFFDLDPTDDTPYDTTVTVARALFDKLKALGLRAYPKTSGADGLHLFVPLVRAYNYEQARQFAEIVTRVVAEPLLKLLTFERTVAKRPRGRVLIDFVQNAFGRPLATAWCARAKAGATVSTPLFPEELKKGLDPAKFTLKTVPARLAKRGDPWADFWKKPQKLENAIARM